jgi:hypothetical protein
VQGCSGPGSFEGDPTQHLGYTFDPALDATDQNSLNQDLDLLNGLEIRAAPGSFYQMIFGSTDATGLRSYLTTRVGFFIPEVDDLSVRVVDREAAVPTRWTDAAAPESGGSSDDPQIVASNVGTAIWFASLASGETLHFRVGDRALPVSSPRVGIIMLGKSYSSFEPIERIGVLIHEARHSDCTGGLSEADLTRIHDDELPSNHACGHIHVDCPPGHDYAGYPACDDHPWGAYSVEAVFLATLAKMCVNCSERDLQMAYAMSADALSRILVLDDMLAGKLGPPDMSSTEVRPG